MNTEKISIVVPVYNSRKTLNRCIESLIQQTYQDIEIILVDDGSKDDSLMICLEYQKQDNRVHVIQKDNGGVSSARNAGIDAAAGVYIMFCDSDDWVEHNWCEMMIKLYVPGNLVMCGYYCHQENRVQWVGRDVTSQTIKKQDFLLTKSFGGFAPWNKFFCLDQIKENGIRFPEGITLGEDQLFVWRYLRHIAGNIIYCQTPLNHYVWPQGQSLTLNLPADYYKQCDAIYSEISKDISSKDACSETARFAFYQDAYFQYERSIRRIFDDKKLKFSNKLKEANQVMNSSEYQNSVKMNRALKNKIMKCLCSRKTSLGLYIVYRLGKY